MQAWLEVFYFFEQRKGRQDPEEDGRGGDEEGAGKGRPMPRKHQKISTTTI